MTLRLSSAQKFLQIRNQRPQINLKHTPFTSNSSAARYHTLANNSAQFSAKF